MIRGTPISGNLHIGKQRMYFFNSIYNMFKSLQFWGSTVHATVAEHERYETSLWKDDNFLETWNVDNISEALERTLE